jgi:hypothetical protein
MNCNEKKSHEHCFPEGASYSIHNLHCHCCSGNVIPGGPGGTEKVHQMDWYVAKNGSDETGDGSQNNPFLTIQRGVNEIAKLPLLETWYNLHVGDGTYLENVDIRNLTFNLIGNVANPKNVIVQGTGEAINIDGDYWYVILNAQHSYLNIQGFTFKSAELETTTGITYWSVLIENASDVTLTNCIFYSDKEYTDDLYVSTHSSGRISNVVFEGPRRKIILTSVNGGKLITYGGISIVGDTIVKVSLMTCTNLGSANIYLPITNTGTITGKQFMVDKLGQLNGKANLPTTSTPGTDNRTNGAFAV